MSVSAHSAAKTAGQPAFTIAFLITPRREIIISHSINGWHNHGVTFASLPYDVYLRRSGAALVNGCRILDCRPSGLGDRTMTTEVLQPPSPD